MKTTYTIIIESESPHPIEAPIRLRQWLKMGLRAFGLKCIDIRETNPSDQKRNSGFDHIQPETGIVLPFICRACNNAQSHAGDCQSCGLADVERSSVVDVATVTALEATR